MKVTTKRYQLEKNEYIKMGITNVVREWWWAFLVPVALVSLTLIWHTHWFWISALIITILYILFWAIQFMGVTQLEQFKMLFDKLIYEIDSRQILIKINAKQGMPLTWDKIQKAKMTDDAFMLIVSKAQIIHLPFKIFTSQNDVKFVESILKRKGFIQ